MGRGRQKAKDAKIARQLKYTNHGSDIRDLEREFNRAKADTRRSLSVGDRVKITKGPFMDIETLITSVRGAKVEFMSPMGKATVPAASVSLVA